MSKFEEMFISFCRIGVFFFILTLLEFYVRYSFSYYNTLLTYGMCLFSELLRVMRRLSMKEQQTDTELYCLTLTSLRSALVNNPRGQNHFRSIGGLEVLLDGLGFPSANILKAKISSFSTKDR